MLLFNSMGIKGVSWNYFVIGVCSVLVRVPIFLGILNVSDFIEST